MPPCPASPRLYHVWDSRLSRFHPNRPRLLNKDEGFSCPLRQSRATAPPFKIIDNLFRMLASELISVSQLADAPSLCCSTAGSDSLSLKINGPNSVTFTRRPRPPFCVNLSRFKATFFCPFLAQFQLLCLHTFGNDGAEVGRVLTVRCGGSGM